MKVAFNPCIVTACSGGQSDRGFELLALQSAWNRVCDIKGWAWAMIATNRITRCNFCCLNLVCICLPHSVSCSCLAADSATLFCLVGKTSLQACILPASQGSLFSNTDNQNHVKQQSCAQLARHTFLQVKAALNHVLTTMRPVPHPRTLTADQALDQRRFEAANANLTVYYAPDTYQMLAQSFKAAQSLLAQQTAAATILPVKSGNAS